MNGKKIDVSSDPQLNSTANAAKQPKTNPFIGVQFDCCGTYARVYRNKPGTHYLGNCPKCAKQVRFKIGSGGSDSRFFTAY